MYPVFFTFCQKNSHPHGQLAALLMFDSEKYFKDSRIQGLLLSLYKAQRNYFPATLGWTLYKQRKWRSLENWNHASKTQSVLQHVPSAWLIYSHVCSLGYGSSSTLKVGCCSHQHLWSIPNAFCLFRIHAPRTLCTTWPTTCVKLLSSHHYPPVAFISFFFYDYSTSMPHRYGSTSRYCLYSAVRYPR